MASDWQMNPEPNHGRHKPAFVGLSFGDVFNGARALGPLGAVVEHTLKSNDSDNDLPTTIRGYCSLGQCRDHMPSEWLSANCYALSVVPSVGLVHWISHALIRIPGDNIYFKIVHRAGDDGSDVFALYACYGAIIGSHCIAEFDDLPAVPFGSLS